jgi:uncharacterized protein (DUF1778 family)
MVIRTAILIHCLKEEADQIRQLAKLDRRTVSGYVLNIVMSAVAFEQRLYIRLNGFRALNQTLARRIVRPMGPKTTMLLRCSAEESKKIRNAAERRETTISGFVVDCLRRCWKASDALQRRPRWMPLDQ